MEKTPEQRDRDMRLDTERYNMPVVMGRVFSGGIYRGPKSEVLEQIAQAFADKPSHVEPHTVYRTDDVRAERHYTEGDDCMHAWPGCSCRPCETAYAIWVRGLGCTACGRTTPPQEEPAQRRCANCQQEAVTGRQRGACDFCGES